MCATTSKSKQHPSHRHRLSIKPKTNFSRTLDFTLAQLKNDCRYAIFLIDLDHFNSINLFAGHRIGDLILRMAANRYTSSLPDGAFLKHLGGDQFLIIVPDIISECSIEVLASVLLNASKDAYYVQGHQFFISCSIGIAITPDHSDKNYLLQNASIALHKAKETRNTFHIFDSKMADSIKLKIKLECALHQAIHNREFSLFYQPLIDCKTGEIYGAESLVRWILDGKIVPPAEFIPLAEETGLIVDLGSWVLREACEQVKRWRDLGLKNIKVSINLSARQFQEPNFLMTITDIVESTKVNPRWIALEITESIMMQNIDSTITILNALRRIGFEISIDDFGTGFSSLSYLRQLPVDRIKIDKSFVQSIESDENKAITRAMIAVGKVLGLKVTAEGVETVEHVNVMLNEQCDEMQGYYFSKPIPAKEFETYVLQFKGKKKEGLSAIF